MRGGIGPDGTRYWPAFPFTSFHGFTDADLADLWAHLRAVEPVAQPELPHTRDARWQLRLWRPLAFRGRGAFVPDPDLPAEVNRGAYLVEVVGHCGECHTPRGALGGLKDRRALAGSDTEPEPGPNLTPHPDALGGWTAEDWVTFLETGMTPEGDFVGGQMSRIIQEGTALLPPEDRAAMAAYLLRVAPRP